MFFCKTFIFKVEIKKILFLAAKRLICKNNRGDSILKFTPNKSKTHNPLSKKSSDISIVKKLLKSTDLFNESLSFEKAIPVDNKKLFNSQLCSRLKVDGKYLVIG